jgi:hypothetical protein
MTAGTLKQFDQPDLFDFDISEHQPTSQQGTTMEQTQQTQMQQIEAPQTAYSSQLAIIEDPFVRNALQIIPPEDQTKLNNVTLAFVVAELNDKKDRFEQLLQRIQTPEDLERYVSMSPQLFLDALNSNQQQPVQQEEVPIVQVDTKDTFSKLTQLFKIGQTMSQLISETFAAMSSEVDKQYATFFVNEVIWTFQAYLRKKLFDYEEYQRVFKYNSEVILADIEHSITNLNDFIRLWPYLLLYNTFAISAIISLFKKAKQQFEKSNRNIGTRTLQELGWNTAPLQEVMQRQRTPTTRRESRIVRPPDETTPLPVLRNGRIRQSRVVSGAEQPPTGGTNLSHKRKYTKKHKRHNKRRKTKRRYLF